MTANKTQPTSHTVADYLSSIDTPQRRADCEALVKLMLKISKHPPVMWGNGNDSGIFSNMVGFGSYHYKYASGTEGDWFITGFANRKTDITLYIMSGFDTVPELMQKLGKYKHSKSCLYIKKLADIDEAVLSDLIEYSIKYIKSTYS